MNGEQILKKSKKTSKFIILGYVICIILIVGCAFWITYKEENETPEPIDFTTDGTIGMEIGEYAYFDVEELSTEVAIYGDLENEHNSENDRYYIAFNQDYMYILDLDFDTIEQLKSYIYSEENTNLPTEPTRVYGVTESIPDELKTIILEYCNEGLEEDMQIKPQDFESYFGSVLLNVRKNPVDTSLQSALMVIAMFSMIILVISHILIAVEKNRVKKYLKKNEYEEDLIYQLDNLVEGKYYKDKIILTKDFFVDVKYDSLRVFKYSDVKWIHIHNLKSYGVTTSSSLMVYLRDGKTKLNCLRVNGRMTEEFIDIFNKICEKLPADVLKGYTRENAKEFKQYKKEL